MSPRPTEPTRLGPAVWVAALLFAAVLVLRIQRELPEGEATPAPAPAAGAMPATAPDGTGARTTVPAPPPVFTSPPGSWPHDPLVADLNVAGGTIADDLAVIAGVLDAWVTNFPHTGNPVGDNAEITAALSGRNRLQLALIPADHPAINADGELCDRHGTPLFFHQISGHRMEIRSAGADRRLFSPDDVMWAPNGRSDTLAIDARHGGTRPE